MKNKINPKRPFYGFSLAEALITLLIVCLITLASVPVLTKKHRNKILSASKENTNEHGKYLCYLKNGVHNYHSEINGETKDETLETDYCEFEPPKDAKDYTIMVIGGGGSGGGSYTRDEFKAFRSSEFYTVPEDGHYLFLLIGAGGGSNGSSYDVKNNFYDDNICSGGIILSRHFFAKGSKLELNVGKGGSPFTVGGVDATDGGDTSLIYDIQKFVATGGGASVSFGTCHPGIPNGRMSDNYYVGPNYDKANKAGLPYYLPNDEFKDNLQRMLSYQVYPPPGCTATKDDKLGSSSGQACSMFFLYSSISSCDSERASMQALRGYGADGYAAILSNEKYCGEGGQAAQVNTYGKYKLDGKIRIIVGAGGKSASVNSVFGEDGKFSKFGNIFVSQGGIGGKSTTAACISTGDVISGENGQVSAFVKDPKLVGACGGNTSCVMADVDGNAYSILKDKVGSNGFNALSYGSGGGGGAYGPSFKGNTEYGVGGDGADGMVYVEW